MWIAYHLSELWEKQKGILLWNTVNRVGQKRATFLLSISLPIIDQFSKFFHWHTLQTICDNVIIIDPTTPYMRIYTTLSPLSSSRQHYHIDDCLEDNREDC